MSASREKKERMNQDPDLALQKSIEEEEKQKVDRRNSIIVLVVGVVFVLVAILAILWKTNILTTDRPAVTIGDEEFSAAEVTFYYANAYQSFMAENYYYLSMLGLDPSKSLKEQPYEDGTWHDYFLNEAIFQLNQVTALNAEAAATGFTWTDELQSSLEENVAYMENAAQEAGYTTAQYLGMIFGSSVTPEVYEEQLKRSLLADAFLADYQDSLTYSDTELKEAYAADPKLYDKVSYEVIRVNAAVAKTDADGNAVEVTEAMETEAHAAAEETANEIYAALQSGQELSSLADPEKQANYTSSTRSSYVNSIMMNWLFDDARNDGDTTLLEDTNTRMFYIIHLRERYRENYNSVNIRHILIAPEESTLAATDPGYADDVAAKDAAAKDMAEELLKRWKETNPTEEFFAQLAEDFSMDSGSYNNGGLYEQIYNGWAVAEFNDWCFDASRKSGDTGVVHNDSTGYHVMYFVGTDVPCWQAEVIEDLAQQDTNTWYAEIIANFTPQRHEAGLKHVG